MLMERGSPSSTSLLEEDVEGVNSKGETEREESEERRREESDGWMY